MNKDKLKQYYEKIFDEIDIIPYIERYLIEEKHKGIFIRVENPQDFTRINLEKYRKWD